MTTFANDTFTGAADTTLQAHAADSGEAWSKGSGGALTYVDAVLTDANRVRAGGDSPFLYTLGYAPANGNYAVKGTAVIQTLVASNVIGPVGRAAVITGGYHTYAFADIYPNLNQYRLYGVIANSFQAIGTYTPGTALAGGQSHDLELRMQDDALALLVDGVGRIAGSLAGIDGIGRAGLRGGSGAATTPSNTTGVHFDGFAIADFSLAGSLAAPTLSTGTVKVAGVDLVWTAVVDAALFRYVVEYKLSADSTWTTGPVTTSTSARVGSLTGGSSYDFRVRCQAKDLTLGTVSNVLTRTPDTAPAQPAAYNVVTGTHSGAVSVGQPSLTADPDQVSVHYGGGKTTFPDDPAFDVGAVCTLRAIVKPDTIPSAGTHRTLIERVNAYSLKMNGSSLEGTVIIGGTPVTVTAASVFVAGTTVDVAVTYDGVNLQLWDGGVQVDAAIPATGVVDAVSTDIVVGDGFIGFIQQPEVLAEALAADRLVEDALALALTERSEILAGPFGTTDSLGNSTMTDLAIKQHDTWPPLTYRLTDVGRDIEAISKTGSTVTVVTETIHRMTTGDYVYIDSTNSYSDDIARSIVVTGPKSFTYTDTDASAKTAEGFGTTARGVDLSTVTAVRLLMRSNTVLVAGTTTIDSPQTSRRGRGSYSWVAPDTAFIGTYNLEFEANFGSGKIETFPNSGYLTVQIVDDLDEVG